MNLLTPSLLLAFVFGVAGAGQAHGQASATAGPLPVIGTVPAMCFAGTLAGAQGTFDLGVLTDAATGLMRKDLAAPPKLLSGAFCSAKSTISIAATPLAAENNLATPPAGFSRRVDYVATASGWTAAPAVFSTGQATNATAVQQRGSAFQGDITVGITGFSTAGGDTLRLVADPSYKGAVTVTLAVAD